MSGMAENKKLSEMDIEELKAQLNGLATAKERPVVYVEELADGTKMPVEAPDHKAIINEKTGEIETIASKGYVIIQHRDAFGAVLDALVASSNGAAFKANVCEQNGRAWMTVVFSNMRADDGMKGIELGIKVTNSYDKTCALKYSGTTKENDEGKFEFFGLRLECMNGMTVKVPIDFATLEVKDKADAKVGDIVGVEKVYQMEQKEVSSYIRHFGKNTEANVARVHQMIMALPIVAKRLEAQIKRVQAISLTSDEAAKRITELGFGERVAKRIAERFQLEEQTAWGLYNSITAYATHDEKVSPLSMDRTLKAAEKIMTMTAPAGRGASPSSQ